MPPYHGMPDDQITVVDLNSDYILKINRGKELTAEIREKHDEIFIDSTGVKGYSKLAERAEDWAKDIYENLEDIGTDPLVELLIENYEKDPEFNKNYDQIFSDWINKNISQMFTKGMVNAPDDAAAAGDGSTLGKLEEFLSNMIGLDEIKEVLRRFVAILEFAEKTKKDFNIETPNLHMVFKGSAGTGKTMLANILAELYSELGMINTHGKPVKMLAINGTSLLVYDAPRKVRDLCAEADGGILLIDEAYSISESRSGVGDEVIASLLTEMEDRKASLAMIFAGYTAKMDKFMMINPGLRSRIGANIFLADYKPEEMLEMIKRKFDKSGFKVTLDAIAEMEKIFKEAVKFKDFGNGRFVARFYQDIISEHAFKVRGISDKEELRTIKARDITRNVIAQTLKGASLA
jgi:AAA+ superfamily predicted ATPase